MNTLLYHLVRLYLGYSNMEITWMVWYSFCPLSNTTAILSICPRNSRGCGYAKHEHLCWRHQLNAVTAQMLLFIKKKKRKKKRKKESPATKQKKKTSPSLSVSTWDMLFHLYHLYCLPCSWVTHLLEDGYVCVGFSCVYLNCPCCSSVGRSWSPHSAS